MQATVDDAVIGQWWEARPEANVILVTGRVFDVLDVPAVAGATALSLMADAGVETGPVAVQGTERMLFFVATRGAPDDEDEWWSCGLDASPDPDEQAEAVRWHCRDSYVLAPPSRFGTGGQDVRWVREPSGRSLPDGVRLLEYLIDACEEEG
jgi:Bifunctional DNA primase/polymerase, N-terminal